MAQAFTTLNTAQIAHQIAQTRQRVVVAAPGIHQGIADALAAVGIRLGWSKTTVIVDCDGEAVRLGYGELKTLEQIQQAGCTLRHCAHLRVGVLIVDQRAWIFAPTPTYAEAEPSADTPNAVEVAPAQVWPLIQAVLPQVPKEEVATVEPADETAVTASEEHPNEDNPSAAQEESLSEALQDRAVPEKTEPMPTKQGTPEESSFVPHQTENAEPEIGRQPVSSELLRHVKEDLEKNPPVEPDRARKIRVLNSKFRLLNLHFKGFQFGNRKIPLKPEDLGITKDDLKRRVGGQWTLFDRDLNDAKLKKIVDPLKAEWEQIKTQYTCSLGEPFGRAILQDQLPAFRKEMNDFINIKIQEAKAALEGELEAALEESKSRLRAMISDHSRTNPEIGRIFGVMTDPGLREKQITNMAAGRVEKLKFPNAQDLVEDMVIDCPEFNVSETLLDHPQFKERVKQAFHLDIDDLTQIEDAVGLKAVSPQ